MPRKKLPDEEKKKKISICLDPKLIKKLKTYLDQNNTNRSKYIENLIKIDIK